MTPPPLQTFFPAPHSRTKTGHPPGINPLTPVIVASGPPRKAPVRSSSCLHPSCRTPHSHFNAPLALPPRPLMPMPLPITRYQSQARPRVVGSCVGGRNSRGGAVGVGVRVQVVFFDAIRVWET